MTEAEAGIRKAVVEPEQQRTEEKPRGRRSLTEPEGQGGGVESQGNGWMMTDQGSGPPEERGSLGKASGLTGRSREEGARSHGGGTGSMSRGCVQDSEAGGIGKGFSSHADDGDWQSPVVADEHCTDGGLRVSRGAAR